MSELGEPEIDPALPPADSFNEYNPPDGNADTPEPEDDAAALIAGSAQPSVAPSLLVTSLCL